MNNLNAILWWTMINFLWSAILILASACLLAMQRQLEIDRQKYRNFMRWQERKERKERQL